jgi:DNA gyrase subunit A
MVQRTAVSGISRMGRPTQGVKVMNIKDDDRVSAVALVVESNGEGSAAVSAEAEQLPASGNGAGPAHPD